VPVSAGPTVHNRLRIKELFARYAWAVDTGDVDGFVALFTPDAVIDDPSGRYAPREYVEYVRGSATFPGRQHWIGHSQVRGDARRCRVRSFGMATHLYGRTGATTITWLGYYEDVLVTNDGTWRFERRTIRSWRGEVLGRFPAYRPAER
jgi:hypothetical protein